MLGPMSLSAILVLGLSLHVAAQVPFPNSCPEVKVVETFDLDRYMGTWYEYSKYPFIFEAGQKCQHAVYKNNGNGTVAVTNTGVYVIINKPHSTSGIAKVIAPGELAVSFGNRTTDKPNYIILGTDYDNWVVVYSCKNVTSYGHTKVIWILTRERLPAQKYIDAAEKVFEDNKLSQTFLIKSTQDDCDIDDSEVEHHSDHIAITSDQPSMDASSTTSTATNTVEKS